jgi:dihydroneopterin triphosphate diphosphatase
LKIPVSCLVVIYTRDMVLLLERQDRPGSWQSVTGSIEAGECLRETASRELQEETGFGDSQGQLHDYWWANQYRIDPYWQARYPVDVHWNTEHVFGFRLSECLSPKLSPQEHSRFEWLEWNEAIKRAFFLTNRQAIEWIARIEGIKY